MAIAVSPAETLRVHEVCVLRLRGTCALRSGGGYAHRTLSTLKLLIRTLHLGCTLN